MTVYLSAARKQATTKKVKIVKDRANLKFSQIFYTLLGCVTILSLSYSIITNKVVTTGYDIKMNEKKLNEMRDKNDELRIKLSELKSVQVLENKIEEIGMVEPEEIDYMRLGHEIALN